MIFEIYDSGVPVFTDLSYYEGKTARAALKKYLEDKNIKISFKYGDTSTGGRGYLRYFNLTPCTEENGVKYKKGRVRYFVTT